jgi:hypothetical protein
MLRTSSFRFHYLLIRLNSARAQETEARVVLESILVSIFVISMRREEKRIKWLGRLPKPFFVFPHLLIPRLVLIGFRREKGLRAQNCFIIFYLLSQRRHLTSLSPAIKYLESMPTVSVPITHGIMKVECFLASSSWLQMRGQAG